MKLTSLLCRAQAAVHRERAAGTSLENVRTIANRAADAWEQEAATAERREKRFAQERLVARARDEQRRLDAAIAVLEPEPDRA